jgi:hypothetical protein
MAQKDLSSYYRESHSKLAASAGQVSGESPYEPSAPVVNGGICGHQFPS